MKTDKELQEEQPELYTVARKGGTEPAGSSDLLYADHEGMFRCAVCNEVLFSGDTKFDSGSGWPSFTDPINKDAVILIEDNTHGMKRTEVQCAKCEAHLGHVFPDGPKREGDGEKDLGHHDRYCVNGISLDHQAT
jgi:peptide-methionine (R)-S-oxide reductase